MSQLPVSPILFVPLVVILGLLAVLSFAGKVPLSYNFRNLLVRWRMTVLTGLAFTLVIALLTVMLAFINGMSRLTEDSGHPENVVVLADGSDDESFSTLIFSDSSDIDLEPGVAIGSEGKPLCSREVYIIASMQVPPREGQAPAAQVKGDIKRVFAGENRFSVIDAKGEAPVYQLAGNAKVLVNNEPGKLDYLKPGDVVWLAYEQHGGDRVVSEMHASTRRRFIQVRGVEDPLIAAEVHGLELLPGGQWFSDVGVEKLSASEEQKESSAVQAVLGEGVARAIGPDLGKDMLQVGDIFELGPLKWKVVGILKSTGTVFGSEIWAKRSYVGQRFGKEYTISSLTIRAQSPERAREVAQDLRDNFKKAKLNPQTETDYYSKQRTFMNILLTAIIVLTVFMALGGIFGVMNTMFAAISQRTKDIGVLRILGYARWQILVSFLLESLVIALAGGLLGCALGALCNGRGATGVIGGGQGFGKTVILTLSVTPNTIAIGIFLTLLMGLVGGLLPALTAMRLRPLESLR
jgi:ABC-type lipoprotein release transport system permease subunit